MLQPLNDAHSARRQLTQLRRHELERSKLERAEAATAAAAVARRQQLLHSQKARQQLALEDPPPVALSKNKSSPRSAARVLDALRFKVAEKQQAEELGLATEAVAREGAACAKELARRGKVRIRVRVRLTLTPNLTPTLTLTPTPTPNRT